MHVRTCERVGKSGSLSICILNLRAWPLQPSPRGPVSGVHSGASTSTGPVWLAVPPPRLYRFEQLMFAHGAVTFRTNGELPLRPAVATRAVAWGRRMASDVEVDPLEQPMHRQDMRRALARNIGKCPAMLAPALVRSQGLSLLIAEIVG